MHIKKLIPLQSYPLWILRDYMKDRYLIYETLDGQKRMEVTSGVAQGSILRLDLWNASYKSLLDMLEESRLVGYADDVVILVPRCTVDLAQSSLGLESANGELWGPYIY